MPSPGLRLKTSAAASLLVLSAIACTDTSAPVSTIAVTPSRIAVRVADSVQLEAQPLNARGRSVRARAVRWSSADTSVARVTKEGWVTGVGSGEVLIKATVGNRAAAAAVTVSRGGFASARRRSAWLLWSR